MIYALCVEWLHQSIELRAVRLAAARRSRA
jgi:hypothetical protein